QRAKQRRLVLPVRQEAYGALVGGVERSVRLQDDVRLTPHIEARRLRMRKHRRRRIVHLWRWSWRVRQASLRRSSSNLLRDDGTANRQDDGGTQQKAFPGEVSTHEKFNLQACRVTEDARFRCRRYLLLAPTTTSPRPTMTETLLKIGDRGRVS